MPLPSLLTANAFTGPGPVAASPLAEDIHGWLFRRGVSRPPEFLRPPPAPDFGNYKDLWSHIRGEAIA